MRILAVGHDPDIRQVIAELTEQHYERLIFEPDWTRAWQVYRREPVSLVISSWTPELAELFRQIRSHPRGSHCVLLVIVSQERTDALAEMLEAGADDFLRAPLTREQVRARLMVAERRLATLRGTEQAALRQHQLDEVERFAHLGHWIRDLRFDEITWSPELYRICGLDPESGQLSVQQAFHATHPDDQRKILDRIEQALSERTPFEYETRVVRPDGSIRFVSVKGEPELDPSGRPVRLLGTVQDITEHKEAEAVLHQTEEQLRQSQKMEAIGLLAGGIAHDFSNLLTAITGFGELILQRMPDEEPLRDYVESIIGAGRRASDLTGQLLAFSRRQLLQPEILDLNTLVAEIDRLLERIIGEDIQVVTQLEPHLHPVRADAGQMLQTIMNLAVNARDAMPTGGTLTITTRNVSLQAQDLEVDPSAHAGPYALLTISDTGEGMDEETQRHVFEPFFTTKELDRGTGLGLATVYGIVRQSGGFIRLHSQPGEGATFQVYLPRTEPTAPQPLHGPARPEAFRGSETVLVVDDDPTVSGLARLALETYGYRVLVASNPVDAAELVRGYDGSIQLLLTDIVMPGGLGPDLALQLQEARPEIRVLFMSGYGEDRAGRTATARRASVIQKPFTLAELARRVRLALDQVNRKSA